jgi:hypothetical protein
MDGDLNCPRTLEALGRLIRLGATRLTGRGLPGRAFSVRHAARSARPPKQEAPGLGPLTVAGLTPTLIYLLPPSHGHSRRGEWPGWTTSYLSYDDLRRVQAWH